MHNVRVLERVYFWQPSAARRAKTSISFELRIRRVATATVLLLLLLLALPLTVHWLELAKVSDCRADSQAKPSQTVSGNWANVDATNRPTAPARRHCRKPSETIGESLSLQLVGHLHCHICLACTRIPPATHAYVIKETQSTVCIKLIAFIYV